MYGSFGLVEVGGFFDLGAAETVCTERTINPDGGGDGIA
jgi:hypothetical protein